MVHAGFVFLAGVSPAIGDIRPGIVDVRLGPREIVILDRAFGNPFVNELARCFVFRSKLTSVNAAGDPSLLFGCEGNCHDHSRYRENLADTNGPLVE
jgi:hypothetical protein